MTVEDLPYFTLIFLDFINYKQEEEINSNKFVRLIPGMRVDLSYSAFENTSPWKLTSLTVIHVLGELVKNCRSRFNLLSKNRNNHMYF